MSNIANKKTKQEREEIKKTNQVEIIRYNLLG